MIKRLPKVASKFITQAAGEGLLDGRNTVNGAEWCSAPLISNPKVYVSFYCSDMNELVMFLGVVDEAQGIMYTLGDREDLAPKDFKYNYASWSDDFKLGHETGMGWLKELHALNSL